MKENLLHYIWQFRQYELLDLKLTNNKPISIKSVGLMNYDAGPDFINSSIVVDDIVWVGCVEIHNKSSDWIKHGHQLDTAYNAVILHVVWENDKQIYNKAGELIPTLELKNIVDSDFLSRYELLKNNTNWIPCQNSFKEVDSVFVNIFLESLLVERLKQKSIELKILLDKNQNDWEETFYQILCRSFGYKVNAEPMFYLAKSLPFKNNIKT